MACSTPVQQITRLVWVCLLVLGLGVAAWSFAEVDRPFTLVNTVGSLQLVNDGGVSPWHLESVNPSLTLGGFGAGTLKGYKNTGEMLSFCGRTFIRTTNPKGDPKVVEVAGTFKSPFALTVTQDPLMAGKLFEDVFPRTYRVSGDEPQLLHSVLEKLAVDAQCPIAVIGWAEMPQVDGVAMKKAPIGDQPLTGDKKDELLDTISTTDAHVVFFAVVSPMLSIPPVANTILAAQAFDMNPDQGQPAAALIHVHGALVNEAVSHVTEITAPLMLDGLKKVTVNDILHIYGTSSIKEGAFIIYRLRYH